MTKAKTDVETEAPTSASILADIGAAIAQGIEQNRPLQKKTILNRKKGGPWAPKDGSAKLKLNRTHYHHAIRMGEDTLSNEEIALLNKIKPGLYCDGIVKVIMRKDRGIDLDYPVRTSSQRLRLVNQFGVTHLVSLLTRIISEGTAPKKAETEDE